MPPHVHLLFLPSHSPALQPCEHLWQFSDAPLVKPLVEPLVNHHFRDIDELEEVQMARCAVLQEQPEGMRSATLFPWGPRRIKERQGPRQS